MDGAEPRVVYRPRGAATRATHFAARTFENTVGHAHGVYEALKVRPDVQPDLVVAHSGFGSSLFLPYLYDAPIINFFEYFYRPVGQDVGYRPELPVTEGMLLRNRCRNGMILLDLDNCDRGWCPNHYQRGLFPPEFRDKIEVIPEGIDTALYRRSNVALRCNGGKVPTDMKVVTYVARGFELMRGFDIFMRAAQIIARECPNVIFVVVGSDRACYGCDEEVIGGGSFRNYVIRSQRCDLSRFAFPGHLSESELAQVLSISDLHVYLTVPFVPSWSLLDAMSCECVVLASDQACTREYITHGQNGLLCDFFDVDGIAAQAAKVLKDPSQYAPVGTAARRTVEDHYSLEVSLPKIKTFFEQVAAKKREPSALADKLIREGTLTRTSRCDRATGLQPVGPALPRHMNHRVKSGATGKTVLFNWELGRALGHMVPMLPLAEALVRRGHRVVVALRNCAGAAAVFGRAGVSFLQAPFKAEGPTYYRRTLSFAHIMANVGWGDDLELFGLACAWRNLIRAVNPHVMVSDYSPTALLAARCFPDVTNVVTGLGFFCPPDVCPLPPLVQGAVDLDRLTVDEKRLLSRSNRILTRWKRPPLERLGQLFGDVDDMFLQTFEELDHYDGRPQGTRYWGPVHAPGGIAPQWPDGKGRKVFAYQKNSPVVGEVLTAIADLGGPAIVLSDRIDPAVRKRFASVPNLRFETQRLDMARVRDECDLAVHNANHGTLCQLLLAGKPMLQVPLQLEQQILARRVEQLGAAETVSARGAEARDEIRAKLHAVATEPRYSEAARRFAQKYESFDPAKQVERMVARVEELIETGRAGDGERGRARKVFAG